MKHGVLITAHNNIPVVHAFMKLLDDERFTFYLLIDKKSKYSAEEFVPDLKKSKVVILNRICINWGGYSQIAAELLLIERAVQDGVDYLHYVQGADLPLKTPEQIDCFFSRGGIYIDISEEPSAKANYRVLCKHFLVEFSFFRQNKIVRYINHGLAYMQRPFMRFKKEYNQLFIGSATWSIPLSFATYVLSLKKEIERQYRYTVTADEVFIQSICMQSNFRNQVSGVKATRYIDWSRNEGNSPRTFTIEDRLELEKAVRNPEMMFARKFSAEKDFEIVEFLMKMLEQ